MDILSTLELDQFTIAVLMINLLGALVILLSVRWLFGTLANVNGTEELASRDNAAYGISLAGVVMGVAIMMTGVTAGEASEDLLFEIVLVAAFGVLGLGLMMLTRFLFDRISMPHFSVSDEIIKGNLAAALLDAGNVIATAIIIRALLVWSENDTISGLWVVLAGYLLSQLILSLASFYRLKLYNRAHSASLQTAVAAGNVAIAWRFTGYRIGVALAITAASSLVPYAAGDFLSAALLWTIISLLMMAVVSIFAIISDRIILAGINLRDEVDNQGNLGIGVVQCAITVAIGLLIAAITA